MKKRLRPDQWSNN